MSEGLAEQVAIEIAINSEMNGVVDESLNALLRERALAARFQRQLIESQAENAKLKRKIEDYKRQSSEVIRRCTNWQRGDDQAFTMEGGELEC